MALTIRARKIAGVRDNWTCQKLDDLCFTEVWLETKSPVTFKSGYYVHLAHYPETQHLSGRGYHDDNPDNARVLCVLCHAMEHYVAGELDATRNVIRSGLYAPRKLKYEDQIFLTMELLDEILIKVLTA